MSNVFDLFLVLFTSFVIIFDIKDKRIPNWLIFPAMVVGILMNSWRGTAQLFDSFLGLGLGIGIFIIPFSLGWLGAGDVKFLGAVGSILGVKYLPQICLYSLLFGGLLALVSIAGRGINLQCFKDALQDFKLIIVSQGAVLPDAVGKRAAKGANTVPYGVAIGLGTLVGFYFDPKGEWVGF